MAARLSFLDELDLISTGSITDNRPMPKNLGTIIGVIVAIIIAWWLVNVLFSVIAFIVKLVIVAVVAVLVYFALRGLLNRGRAD